MQQEVDSIKAQLCWWPQFCPRSEGKEGGVGWSVCMSLGEGEAEEGVGGVPEPESTILSDLTAQDSGTWAAGWYLYERCSREKERQLAKGAPQNPPQHPRRAASLPWSQGAMEMENTAASTRFHQPHMERKMSAMTCEIFNELRLEGKLCDVVIKVNGLEFNAHKNILCSCSSYFRYNRGSS